MNQEQIKINKLAKFFNSALITSGLTGARKGFSNLSTVIKPFSFLHDGIIKIKQIPTGEKDMTYWFTTKENWEEMCDYIYGIAKNFRWEAERYDCDDRAQFAAALARTIFRINSIGICWCKVSPLTTGYAGMHYNNIIVTQDGEAMLFDVDNGGLRKIIEPNQPISFGAWKYDELRSTSF